MYKLFSVLSLLFLVQGLVAAQDVAKCRCIDADSSRILNWWLFQAPRMQMWVS